MNSNSLKSPFHVCQLSPTERSVSDLLFWDLFLLCGTDVHFDLGGEETVPQFSLAKEGQWYFLFFLLWVSWLCSSARQGICPYYTQHSEDYIYSCNYIGYSPKAQCCRHTALISYEPAVAFLTQPCLMLYAEQQVQDATAIHWWATLWEAPHTPVTVLLPFQEERLLGEWRKRSRGNLALVSRGYNNKKEGGNFFCTTSLKSGKQPLARRAAGKSRRYRSKRRQMMRDRVNFFLNNCV